MYIQFNGNNQSTLQTKTFWYKQWHISCRLKNINNYIKPDVVSFLGVEILILDWLPSVIHSETFQLIFTRTQNANIGNVWGKR